MDSILLRKDYLKDTSFESGFEELKVAQLLVTDSQVIWSRGQSLATKMKAELGTQSQIFYRLFELIRIIHLKRVETEYQISSQIS